MGTLKKEPSAKSYRRLYLGHATPATQLLKLFFLVHFFALNSFKLTEGEYVMKKAIYLVIMLAAAVGSLYAQRGTTFTGTAVIYGTGLSTRTITRPFTLIINSKTAAADIQRYLSTLERGGQDALLREIDNNDLGRFSLGASVGVPIGAVLIDRDGDETRIRVVFRRWMGFGELRAGLRSVDYPFGYV